MHATDLQPVASDFRSLMASSPRALTIEQFLTLDMPAELTGEFGTNRAKGGVCQIEAHNDLSAVWTWLEEFAESPKTLRSYRKEAERFYNWAIFVAGKPLSSITLNDITRYKAFMLDPQPAEFWVADKSQRKRARRGEPNWRPFEKSLLPSSIAYATVVLAAMFEYLRDVDYLHGNPFAARRLKAKKAKTGGRPVSRTATQYLPLSALQSLVAAFEGAIAASPLEDRKTRAKLERMLFLSRFLANTGLRRDEMANAVMSDIFVMEHKGVQNWFLHVVGKGKSARDVPLNAKAREALHRYWAFHGVPVQHVDNPMPILLPLSGKAAQGGNLSSQTVYEITKEALMFGAAALDDAAPEQASLMRKASPHKFRHSFATILTEVHGVSLKMAGELLGHSSVDTTSIYTHTDMFAAFNAINNAGL